MIQSQRHLFDIPKDIAYFNCSSNSPLLSESVKRLHQGVISKSHPWEKTPADFFEDAETIRTLASELFDGDADGFAVVPAASYGLSTAARVIEPVLQKGDQILVISEDFPSVVLPLRRIARETGAELITVEAPQNGNWTQAILHKIDQKVKVVACSSCHWTNGTFIDVLKIRQACDAIDAIFILDATQTLGAMPLSINEVKPDFLVAAGYKWLLSPYGFSLFHVGEKWRNGRPLEETWLARENAQDFTNLVNYSDSYMKGARRFEVGEKCVPTLLPGAIAAFEQIKEWGIQHIADSLANINNQIEIQLAGLGFITPEKSQRCPHILGALVPENYSGNLVNELKEQNIFISQRGGSLRFAPHLHVDHTDISRLNEAIRRLVS